MNVQTLAPQELDYLRTIHTTMSSEPTAVLNSSILSLLATIDRELRAKWLVEQQYKPGDIIFKEGDVGDAMYLIRSGQVIVFKGDPGSPIVLGYRGAGEIIGEMALLDDRPRSATVVATEPLCLLKISQEDFQTWLGDNPSLRVNLMKVLSARLREADEVRTDTFLTAESLTQQISYLETEKQKLLELQRLREETSELIVHDLRNPLSLVAGAINMLEMVLPQEILQANREILDLALTNTERLKRLVDSFLDIARMEAGAAELLLVETDLLGLIKTVVNRMIIAVQGTGVTFFLSLPDELPLVMVDEEKIDRVMANLIDNAIKFTPKGGQIAVTAERREGHVWVSVANSGPSISPEDQERIFDRFTQVADALRRRHGSGLGLAFCRLVAAAHGGRIWVEPGQGGEGNRFIFSLPLPTGKKDF